MADDWEINIGQEKDGKVHGNICLGNQLFYWDATPKGNHWSIYIIRDILTGLSRKTIIQAQLKISRKLNQEIPLPRRD